MADRDAQWFRSRIPAHDAGLLADADTERFEALLQEAECARVYASFVEEDPEGEAIDAQSRPHISPELIARWSTLKDEVRGLERKMIRSHLEACDQCRQDLELLGYEPALEFRVELEAAVQAEPEAERAEGHAVPRPRVDIVTVVAEGVSRGRHFWRWLMGGSAMVAAAAAAVTLVLVRGGAGPGGALYVGAPSAASVQLVGNIRGGGTGDVARVRVGDDTRMIRLDLSGLNIGVGEGDLNAIDLEIIVTGPGGKTFGPVKTTAEAIASSPLTLTSDESFAPGVYAMQVNSEVVPPVTYRFRVVTSSLESAE